jgi:uncharacterized membrane protein YidH (DUF202 family)
VLNAADQQQIDRALTPVREVLGSDAVAAYLFGLAALGGGLAVARALVFKNQVHQVLAHVIGGLLVVWGAGIFVYAIIQYHRTRARLSQEGLSRNSLGVMILMTAMLLIIATLVFWITLQ